MTTPATSVPDVTDLLNSDFSPHVAEAAIAYVHTYLLRERNAQLDQAGDVSEDSVRLHQVFFDLSAALGEHNRPGSKAITQFSQAMHSQGIMPDVGEHRVQIARALAGGQLKRVVIVGGPGEGKSTIGQYVAQLHRAAWLNRLDEVAIDESYRPVKRRFPVRIVLKDFAQWLAHGREEHPGRDGLEDYVSRQISSVGKGDVSSSDVYHLLARLPSLIILDGLDEVTEHGLRDLLLQRIVEFVDRCDHSPSADMQIVATTRPTGYREQFDPQRFVHLRLTKLEPDQAREYLQRWIVAKSLDGLKADRLRSILDECLADPQISLLMTTPLQVTILLLIVSAGGTPPRQREALFNEYLEVIYKREKAKGRAIIKSEKEHLLALHKYVGYILHEETTGAEGVTARLPRTRYEQLVRKFLTEHDPYSPAEAADAELQAITRDAGERLVLIVESPTDEFGFELRSIQEFFAACYLTDTSVDTAQRFDRLEAISTLPHWRNVVLFFVGRIGRNFSGEAANVVETCRAMDREGPDLFLKRGAQLALELAAERALGANRRLQRSLLEHGLKILEVPLAASRRSYVTDVLRRLPAEDVRDHVVPILGRRLEVLAPDIAVSTVRVLAVMAPASEEAYKGALSLSRSPSLPHRRAMLGISTTLVRQHQLSVRQAIAQSGLDAASIADAAGGRLVDAARLMLADLASAGVPTRVIADAASLVVGRSMSYYPYAPSPVGGCSDPGAPYVWPEELAHLPASFEAAALLDDITHFAKGFGESRYAAGSADQLSSWSARLPSLVRRAEMPQMVKPDDAQQPLAEAAGLWTLHLALGDVSAVTLDRFRRWIGTLSAQRVTELHSWLSFVGRSTTPAADALLSAVRMTARGRDGAVLWQLGERYAGIVGWRRWLEDFERCQSICTQARDVVDAERRVVEVFGTPGSFVFDFFLGSDVADVALQWPRTRARWVVGRLLDSVLTTGARLDSYWGVFFDKDVRNLGPAQTSRLIAWILDEAMYHRAYLAHSLLQQVYDAQPDAYRADLLRLARHASSGSTHVAPSPRVTRRLFCDLLELTEQGDADVRIGAANLVAGTVLVHQVRPLQEAPRYPRVRDIAARRRALLASNDEACKLAGVALFGAYPPRSNGDWLEFRALAFATNTEDFNRAVGNSLVDASRRGNSALWVERLSDLLNNELHWSLRSIIAERLLELLSSGNQSLVNERVSLALPAAH